MYTSQNFCHSLDTKRTGGEFLLTYARKLIKQATKLLRTINKKERRNDYSHMKLQTPQIDINYL
jgi:hypothetical protein